MDHQGRCEAPTSDYITKSACCCSVGRGWGPHCERCPTPGSLDYQELCPGGSGYKPSQHDVTVSEIEYLLLPMFS